MSSRLTVAGVTGCVLSEDGHRVTLSVVNRRGQVLDLGFAAADFAGLMPMFLATATMVRQRGGAIDETASVEQLWQLAAPATELASRSLDDGVVAHGFRLEGSAAELWLACEDKASPAPIADATDPRLASPG